MTTLTIRKPPEHVADKIRRLPDVVAAAGYRPLEMLHVDGRAILYATDAPNSAEIVYSARQHADLTRAVFAQAETVVQTRADDDDGRAAVRLLEAMLAA